MEGLEAIGDREPGAPSRGLGPQARRFVVGGLRVVCGGVLGLAFLPLILWADGLLYAFQSWRHFGRWPPPGQLPAEFAAPGWAENLWIAFRSSSSRWSAGAWR